MAYHTIYLRLSHSRGSHHRKRHVLYDNHRGKGHHRHLLSEESGYSFFTVDQLLTDFKRDIESARESLQ